MQFTFSTVLKPNIYGDSLQQDIFNQNVFIRLEEIAIQSESNFNAIENEIDGSGLGKFTPYFIASNEPFTVPEFKQVLFMEDIDLDGELIIDGYLIEVD